MPDWISHILLGLIICEIFNVRKKSLVLVGAVLPDVILKLYTVSVILPINLESFYWILYPLHTIAGIFLFGILIAGLFRYDRKKTFLFILAGALSHIMLDLTTKPLEYNIQALVLFPFSWKAHDLGLFYSEQYWIIALILFLAYAITLFIKRYSKTCPT